MNRWVIISEKRGERPKEFQKNSHIEEGKVCFFCPGNEALTPPEIYKLTESNRWKIRVFPNKFPFASKDGSPKIIKDKNQLMHSYAFGHHEVIVETPNHQLQLGDLSIGEIKNVLKVYSQRINELFESPETKYVVIFKNHGAEAGTSLVHSHTQLVSLNIVPTKVTEELDAIKKLKSCPYCDIVKMEQKSERLCFENSSFIAFTPYASRFNYEIWLVPKKHHKGLDSFLEDELFSMAEIIKEILEKLHKNGFPYNFYLHISPKKENLHFHIEFIPRLSTWAGFEYCTDIAVNSVSPESAAKFYKGTL